MSVFSNRLVAARTLLICTAALLLTSAAVVPSPVQAGVGPLTETVIRSIIYSVGLFLWRDNDPDRRGRNLVAMPVPLEAVGTEEAQKDVQCMVNYINSRVLVNKKGWLGHKFFKGKTKKVVLKSGTLPAGRYGQARTTNKVDEGAEITLDLEQIRNNPITDSYGLDVSTTVFHEVWHVANPENDDHNPGNPQFPEDDPRYWDGGFSSSQKLAWERIFGQQHPNWQIANGKERKKEILIGPGYYDSCFYEIPANKREMHGR
jgi:hypothetical protein